MGQEDACPRFYLWRALARNLLAAMYHITSVLPPLHRNPNQNHTVSCGRTTSFFPATLFCFSLSRPSTIPARPPGTTSTSFGCIKNTCTPSQPTPFSDTDIEAPETQTHRERARAEEPLEPREQLPPHDPISRQVQAPKHLDDLPVRFQALGGDGGGARREERAPRRERRVPDRLRFRGRDRVVHELDGRTPRRGGDRGREGRGGEGAVEDVRRAEGGEARGVVRGRGGDDGRELVQACDLDGCMRALVASLRMWCPGPRDRDQAYRTGRRWRSRRGRGWACRRSVSRRPPPKVPGSRRSAHPGRAPRCPSSPWQCRGGRSRPARG